MGPGEDGRAAGGIAPGERGRPRRPGMDSPHASLVKGARLASSLAAGARGLPTRTGFGRVHGLDACCHGQERQAGGSKAAVGERRGGPQCGVCLGLDPLNGGSGVGL